MASHRSPPRGEFNPSVGEGMTLTVSPSGSESAPKKESFRGVHAAPPPPSMGFFPLRILLLITWMAFIAVLIWLLESSVKDGRTNPNPPAHFKVLPDIFLTFFAQAHAGITASFLSRVTVSALASPKASPRTWAELFWMSDRAWSGPIGMLSTIQNTLTMRIRVSLTYLLFAFVSILAIATPSFLTRGFPVETIPVNVPGSFNFRTFDPDASFYDAYLQEGLGRGSWGSGVSTISLFNSSVFVPESTPDVRFESLEPPDIFVAGDILSANATLPGLRLHGGCFPDTTGAVAPLDELSGDAEAADLDFRAFCIEYLDEPEVALVQSQTYQSFRLTMNVWLCSISGFSSLLLSEEGFKDRGLVYYTYDEGDLQPPGSGLIYCEATLETGYADLRGDNRTFSSFQGADLFGRDISRGGEPPSQPMSAAWHGLVESSDRSYEPSFLNGLGFEAQAREGGGLQYPTPSVEQFADRFWSSIAHVTANMAILSWSEDKSYEGTEPIIGAVYVKVLPYAYIAYGLLAAWFILLVLISVYSLRRSFTDNLDSYVTATIVSHHGMGLLDGVPLGDAGENEKLKGKFAASEIQALLEQAKGRA